VSDPPRDPGPEEEGAKTPVAAADPDAPSELEERPEGEAGEEEDRSAAVEPEAAVSTAGALVTTGRADWKQSFLVPILAVITALFIGALVIVFSNPDVISRWDSLFSNPAGVLGASWDVVRDSYYALFTGALGSPSRIAQAIGSGEATQIRAAFGPLSETIVVATPLIFVGLSVALGFRAGLFNIGAEGQLTAGAILGVLVGFSFPGLPGPLLLTLVIAAGFVGGAIWGAIPGILKARTGAHEVITTIMLNFIAAQLALYLLSLQFFRPPQRADPISKPVEAAYPRLFGAPLRAHLGILVAIAVAVLVAWLLNRTTIGFEFRAVGANPDAARAAGMSPGRTIMVVMATAGGLAGLGGASQLASVTPSLTPGFSSGLGFDAIALALLGRARPMGVVLAAFLFGMLRAGSRAMQAATRTPVDIVVVIQALIIMFIAAPALVRAIYRIRARRVAGAETFTKGWGG
jgi:general nucleoside transport system permease protein